MQRKRTAPAQLGPLPMYPNGRSLGSRCSYTVGNANNVSLFRALSRGSPKLLFFTTHYLVSFIFFLFSFYFLFVDFRLMLFLIMILSWLYFFIALFCFSFFCGSLPFFLSF